MIDSHILHIKEEEDFWHLLQREKVHNLGSLNFFFVIILNAIGMDIKYLSANIT